MNGWNEQEIILATKIARHHSKSYYPVVLWLDDLQDIYEVLRSSSDHITIESKEHRFESISDVAAHFNSRTINYLKISSYSPHVSLELFPLWVSVWADGDKKDKPNPFYPIDRILSARQRKFPFLYSFVSFWILLGIDQLASAFVPLYMPYSIYPKLAALAWLIWLGWVRMRSCATINLVPRASARSFWERNRDQIFLALISGLVGAILGVAATKLSDRF